MQVRFYEIEWDTDGKDVGLPSECTLRVEDDMDVAYEGADALSDEHGWCVVNFQWEKVRTVEYWRMWQGAQGDSGTWDTDYIEIPADTPDDELVAAIKQAVADVKWRAEPPFEVGLYCESDPLE